MEEIRGFLIYIDLFSKNILPMPRFSQDKTQDLQKRQQIGAFSRSNAAKIRGTEIHQITQGRLGWDHEVNQR
jgi:hypothetical protein